jgi:hypothetical protein
MTTSSRGGSLGWAGRHPSAALLLVTAIVLAILAVCAVALVTSRAQPHAALAAVVGFVLGLGLQLAGYAAWRAHGRTAPAVSLSAGLIAVLASSAVGYGEGWVRAFGAALLLPCFACLSVGFLIVAARRG